MNWILTDSYTLTELTTGFVIHLLGGSWSCPEEVIPESPEDIMLSVFEQARLLRMGLEYAELHHMDCAVLSMQAAVSNTMLQGQF